MPGTQRLSEERGDRDFSFFFFFLGGGGSEIEDIIHVSCLNREIARHDEYHKGWVDVGGEDGGQNDGKTMNVIVLGR